MRIKKGDTVQVLSGNDKGKKGEVLEVMPKDSKVVVKGVNVRKKHINPNINDIFKFLAITTPFLFVNLITTWSKISLLWI